MQKVNKISELRSSVTNGAVSLEVVNKMRTSKNAKTVFDSLFFDYNDKCYSNFADSILKAVKFYSQGFVSDIANRFSDPSNKFAMSEKQAWCVAFAFIKIEDELGEEIF